MLAQGGPVVCSLIWLRVFFDCFFPVFSYNYFGSQKKTDEKDDD
ncbi:hypothetical protein B4113_0568 [Geobacillus sp. B4113_201601]|nr:hypothetical protein B4113_0568 [Geobacillus sp. B4113_201601]